MRTIEGWPYANHPQQGKDLQTKFQKAEKALHRAEAKMRRAFAAWEKARREHKRIAKLLEKEPPLGKGPGVAEIMDDAHRLGIL